MPETKIIQTSKTIIFQYNKIYYKYVYQSGGTYGFTYLYKGPDMIYGPYDEDCTDEGKNVMKIFRNEHIM